MALGSVVSMHVDDVSLQRRRDRSRDQKVLFIVATSYSDYFFGLRTAYNLAV